MFQTSTIDALLAGAYDGETTCRELQRHGNLGIGTFDHLDGEMVLSDGIMYQPSKSCGTSQPPSSVRRRASQEFSTSAVQCQA